MADEITKDFNHNQITKSETTVSLPALQEVFQTLWKNQFPKNPWTNDRASVEKFEENVRKACRHRAESRKNQQQNLQKINRILASLQKEKSWYQCDWDVVILSKVLVDCRVFKLDGISVELCDSIKGILAIRNKMAHPTTSGVETKEFEDTMKSLKKHLEGLKCVIPVDKHLQTVEELESQENPKNKLKILNKTVQRQKAIIFKMIVSLAGSLLLWLLLLDVILLTPGSLCRTEQKCCLQELREFNQNSTLEKVHYKESPTYYEERLLQVKSNETLKNQYNIQSWLLNLQMKELEKELKLKLKSKLILEPRTIFKRK